MVFNETTNRQLAKTDSLKHALSFDQDPVTAYSYLMVDVHSDNKGPWSPPIGKRIF